MLNIVKESAANRDTASGLVLTDITSEASKLPAFDGHERVWLGSDRNRGLTAIVGIHNTVLGPACGGTRIWPYESFDAAVTDALRLSRGMTFKSAIAGLPFGGDKAVIIADPKTDKTSQLLEAYAEMLQALDGQYFTGEDVGMTLADADYIRERTPYISGTTVGGSGNPSPVTARGVYLGLKAAWKYKSGTDSLNGVRIAVQGLGSVGWALAEDLAKDGAKLVVADVDAERVAAAVKRLCATAIDVGGILFADAEILAPCALGGILNKETIPQVKVRVVAGAANNQLADHGDAQLLAERGILYAPDYVINGGGIVNVAMELMPGGYDRKAVEAKVAQIPVTLTTIFQRAEKENRPTNDVSLAMAREIIACAGRRP